MEEILNILFWIGTLAGGILVILLLLSILGGVDLGGDVDVADVDVGDVDAGADVDTHVDGGFGDAPLGLIKTILTFISVGAFTGRAIMMNTGWSWAIVAVTSLIAGAIAVFLLSWFFKWLLRNQEEGNWHMWQAEGKMGIVYVPIPAEGKGRIIVKIDDVNREIAARTANGLPIGSKEKVLVVRSEEDHVIVTPVEASVEF
jgi:membrane protein implicated in regulation of membrane protease activity